MVGQQTTIIHVVGFILFLAMGLLGTFWARSLQTYELKLYAAFSPFSPVAFLEEYVGSEIYIWQVRMVGVACLGAAGALVYAVLASPAGTLPFIAS